MKYRIIRYDDLIKKLFFLSKNQTKFTIQVKDIYMMIQIPKYEYHITIFRDQWDQFRDETDLNYYLFHVSSEKTDPKCSTYFWVDMETNLIKKIPAEYFAYGQEKFSMKSSTRMPCDYELIKDVVSKFQKILLHVTNIELRSF